MEVYKLLVALGVAIVAVTAVGAGELYLELPADLSAEDVLNPTAEVSARLDTLVREETAKHPAYAEFSILPLP